MEISAETVLSAVEALRARTHGRVFTLFEVAEAMWPGPARVHPGAQGPGHWPPYVTAIDRILRELGEEGKLPVTLIEGHLLTESLAELRRQLASS